MTLRWSVSIFGLKSSFEKVRKWTTNQWSFMSLSSTTLMKFIQDFPRATLEPSEFSVAELSFHPVVSISEKKYALCMPGRVTLFSQNLWIWPYWSGKSKHKLFPNFSIIKHNDNLLIKIYLQAFSLLPHAHMQYKLLLITRWLKDVKANLDLSVF